MRREVKVSVNGKTLDYTEWKNEGDKRCLG